MNSSSEQPVSQDSSKKIDVSDKKKKKKSGG